MDELLRGITLSETLDFLVLLGEFFLAVIMKKLNDKLERMTSKEGVQMDDVLSKLNKIQLWVDSN
ncbi:hypothetical protein BI308_25855 [Roseofilum reptotaenium AO1-A]|uniref:Uncharacterized protein n=1 Tax=Roseofilum reptotaenium AO1-A TaxID=1925591 RepID=A0A1L9QCB2_9CYAN|nr:hypothetical protein BI308_25855 [Roseofilum reptotaenium AO1-A]